MIAAATYPTDIYRYITDRFLPDKAIDLIDESAARLNIELSSKPERLDELDRKMLQLQMERLSISCDEKSMNVTNTIFNTENKDNTNIKDNIKKYISDDAHERIIEIDKQLNVIRREQENLQARWNSEKAGVARLQELKQEVENITLEMEKQKEIII